MMISVDIKALTELLNKFCKDSVTKAAGICVSRGNYEVTIEHVLLAMADNTTADIQQILRHFEIEPARLLNLLQRDVEYLRSGNQGRPVLSPILMELLQEAWLLTSVEYRLSAVRSGTFLAALIANRARYGEGRYLDELEHIQSDVLRRELPDIVAESSEEPAALGTKEPGEADEGQLPQGDTALAQFTINFTERARKGDMDPVFARDREMRQIINILGRRQKNNPIIVSEPGVGKTAMVGELARRVVNGDVPDILCNVEVLSLDMGLLQAGASVRGEFENRIKSVIAEVKASPKPIILFIDEAHTMIGAGGAAGGSDAANLLKPALARGELRTIAATTWSEYKKYFEKDPALARRFQLVKLENPTDADAIVMLRGLREKYEEAHNVHILDEAVVAAGELGSRYISGRQQPDKGVDLMDTAASRVKLSLTSKPDVIDDTERRIETLQRELDSLLRDRETGAEIEESRVVELETAIEITEDELDALTKQWQREKEAAEKVIAIRKQIEGNGGIEEDDVPEDSVLEDADALKKELIKALADFHEIQREEALIHLQVDADVIAKVVGDMTGIPVGRMVRDEAESILYLENALGERLKGQSHVIEGVSRGIRAAKAGLKNPQVPMGVFLFVGPSGTGKTECALTVADLLFGGEQFMATINMSEFQEKHTVSRLIGSPPGYVGYGEGGVLTEAVRQRPYSVVLLDEVEKADLEVMNLFYQVFDKGMLSDGEGRIIDFKNTIIFLTSNLASDVITKMCQSENQPDVEEVAKAIRPILSDHFRPALLARMTIVPFFTISAEVMQDIVVIKLNQLGDRLWENHRITFDFDPNVVQQIAARCTEVETGARNIDHIMRGTLLPAISTELLQQMTIGPLPDCLMLGLGDDGNFTFEFSDRE
ncbi:MAG: type VI secretion system ATPase TssH [Candidatus Poribacteria bacterium]|nr:type VI secretion system ATPase TssH [Candidatus Poribacteria bacterium]